MKNKDLGVASFDSTQSDIDAIRQSVAQVDLGIGPLLVSPTLSLQQEVQEEDTPINLLDTSLENIDTTTFIGQPPSLVDPFASFNTDSHFSIQNNVLFDISPTTNVWNDNPIQNASISPSKSVTSPLDLFDSPNEPISPEFNQSLKPLVVQPMHSYSSETSFSQTLTHVLQVPTGFESTNVDATFQSNVPETIIPDADSSDATSSLVTPTLPDYLDYNHTVTPDVNSPLPTTPQSTPVTTTVSSHVVEPVASDKNPDAVVTTLQENVQVKSENLFYRSQEI